MTISGSVEFTWCGVDLVLLPDRALFLPRSETLLVADVHLGKPASFRARGVPVPEAVTAGDLDRLSCLLDRLTPRRVIVLGDLVHDAHGLAAQTATPFRRWRARHREVSVELIPGNHDARTRGVDLPGVTRLSPVTEIDGLDLCHAAGLDPARPTLCGHIHPGVRLGGRTRDRLRVPVFWFEEQRGILPAFGQFTGLQPMPADNGARAFAAGTEEVVALHRWG